MDKFNFLVIEYKNNYELIAVHKYIADLFKDIVEEYPKENFDLAKMAILIELDNGIDSIREGPSTNYNKGKFYREIEFIKTFAIPLCRSFVNHKNYISSIYSRLLKYQEINEFFGTENMILFKCFHFMDYVSTITCKYAKKYNEIDLLWEEYVKIFLIIQLREQVIKLEQRVNKLSIPSALEFMSEISKIYPEKISAKQSGRPRIMNLDIMLDVVKLREQNKYLSITDVLRKVSEKHDINETTIRKWFTNNKRYLPNYPDY